jgi:hypothetical protein
MGTAPKQLDQFLTKPEVALQCVQELIDVLSVPLNHFDRILEPSSVEGPFVNAFSSCEIQEPKLVYVDIDAKDEHHRADFLTSDLIPKKVTCLTIGNVPFGKNASLPVAFLITQQHFPTSLRSSSADISERQCQEQIGQKIPFGAQYSFGAIQFYFERPRSQR